MSYNSSLSLDNSIKSHPCINDHPNLKCDEFKEERNSICNDVAVCEIVEESITYFSIVYENKCNIFTITKQNKIELLQEYIDDNINECFNCCEWIVTRDGNNDIVDFYLLIGGNQCIIKVLDCLKRVVYNVLEGHMAPIQVIRSFHNNSPHFLSGSADGTVRLWNLHKRIPLSIIPLFESFSIIQSIDISLCNNCFVCTDQCGTVCLYLRSKDNCFTLSFTIYTGYSINTLLAGELLLGVINNACSLYFPIHQLYLNEPINTTIKIVKQFEMPRVPTSFCINYDYTVIACLFNSTIQLYSMDEDKQPYASFVIPEYNIVPKRIFLCGTNNNVLVLTSDNKLLLYSIQENDINQDHFETDIPSFDFPIGTISAPLLDFRFDSIYDDNLYI